MMNFQQFTHDVSRCFVHDQKGLIADAMRMKILGWIRSRDVAKLSTCPDHFPEAYQQLEEVRFTRQIAAFYKKNAAFVDGEVCTAAAQHSFEGAEKLCRITNRRLDHYYLNRDRLDPRMEKLVARAERIIFDVLGDFNEFFEGLPSRIRVTAGATATRSRLRSVPYMKINMRNVPATPRAIPYIRALGAHFGYPRMTFKETRFNRVETVPKNYKTDRTIACEPEGNLTLQLALDGYIKERLRTIGVNLSSQFSNQLLAKEGSVTDTLSTIDLSMASDTVAFNTVAWLLPDRWFNYVDDIRTPCGRGFGKEYNYAKFSSMGNGATFTLETLIFASFVRATGAKRYAVYGDDIIIPSKHNADLLALLKFFGFQVNQSKSFTDGPFRESCGADWYLGMNVTPFYLRGGLSLKTEDCHNVNGLAGLALPDGKLEAYLLELVTSRKLPLVPFNESTISGVWIDIPSAYAKGIIKTRKYIAKFKAYQPRSKRSRVTHYQTYFLWHLDATRTRSAIIKDIDPMNGSCLDREHDYEPIIRSRTSTFTHKYERKWVYWNPPVVATPVHLYRWTDLLIRIS
jgi:hypothetical protein